MIHTDPTHGHVTAWDDDGQILATVLDMGGTCAVDSLTHMMTPEQAIQYAHAVLRWALAKQRKQREEKYGPSYAVDGILPAELVGGQP